MFQSKNEVNKVYKTSDLSIFKQIDGNRIPNLNHVKRLSQSINSNGMKCNPILVNEQMQVIDGQHRLMAAKESNSFIYYIIIDGYSLNEVHTLNLNQKNWSKKDFMEGYAKMGVDSYVKLSKFTTLNDDFSFSDCVALCSNLSTASSSSISQSTRGEKAINTTEIFEGGTWNGKDFQLAQEWANKIRMIRPYYKDYNRSAFVGIMIKLFTNDDFDFNEFLHKLRSVSHQH